MNFKLTLLLLIIFSSTQNTNAQSVAINTDGSTANASAMLDVKSSTKGLLIPRMTRTERNAIASPVAGLMIFQSGPDSIGFHYYDGSKWTWMFSNSNADSLAWRTGGNTGTTAANNFIGTRDNNPLIIKTNNTEQLRVLADGKIGVGIVTPFSTLSNTATDIKGVDGYGLTSPSLGWAMNTDGFTGAFYNGSNSSTAAGLLVKIAGNNANNRLLDLSVGGSQNTAGAPIMVVNGNGLVGLGTSNPISTLANTNTTITGSDGTNVNQFSLSWVMNFNGYAAAIYNAGGGSPTGNGLAVKVNGNNSNTHVLDVSSNASQASAGTPVLIANADGKVGIGTNTPNSNLQVDGTMAVGITMNIAGGPSASPVSLASAKYYIGLLPADATNNNYQLPSPVLFPGRVYIIRNNSSTNPAVLLTAAGLFFPGSSSTGGTSYTLNATTSVKTVMVIADGSNWTIIKQD